MAKLANEICESQLGKVLTNIFIAAKDTQISIQCLKYGSHFVTKR